MNLIGVLLFVVSSRSLGSHTLGAEHTRLLKAWLADHPTYRVATDQDCDCDEDIAQMKRGLDNSAWKPVPGYHPYQVVGDFNGDGATAFAVVLVDTSRPDARRFVLAIFNGPFRSVHARPAFLEKDLDLKYQGLFYGPPRPTPYRLLVGPFESDAGGLLVPQGSTYRWETSDDVD